jgi:hypothetical protein
MRIDPTDVDRLPVPACLQRAELGVRAERIHGHAGAVKTVWWNRTLNVYGLLGGPLSGEVRRCRDGSPRHYISRGDVFALACQIDQDEVALLRLLWHALAWGSGFELLNKKEPLAVIVEDVPRVVAVLREAAGTGSGEVR